MSESAKSDPSGGANDTQSSERLVSHDKLNGDVLGSVTADDRESVRRAFDEARRVQARWREVPIDEKLALFRELSHQIVTRKGEITDLIHRENGKTTVEAYSILIPCLESIKLFSRIAKEMDRGKRVSSSVFFGARSTIYYRPKGVIGFIVPWNFPFEIGFKHLPPALLMGNAVVQKPSEQNPLIGELIRDLFVGAGFPENLVQMVHGYADVASEVVEQSDAVVFTGSTRVGRIVGEQAGKRMIPAVLELGGKDAAVVREDADVELTARGIVQGACFNSGQTCVSIERVYVHEKIADALVEAITRNVDALRLAAHDASEYELGPTVVKQQTEVYRRHLDDAVQRGARIVRGGYAIESEGMTQWLPTVLTDCTHDMLVMREETFGPFIAIQRARSDDEMIALANDSAYGLSGSVWTRDVERGEALARRIDTGSVMINNSVQVGGNMHLPFGGLKDSGVGLLASEHSMLNYATPQSVMSGSERVARGSWMPYGASALPLIVSQIDLLYGRDTRKRLRALRRYVQSLMSS